MDVIINDKRKIIVQGNVFWIRVKELDAWVPDFKDDNNDDLCSDEEEPKANNIDETSDVDRVSESSFMQEMDHVIDSVRVDSTRSEEPKYPPGFTPSFNDQEKIGDDNLQGISDSGRSNEEILCKRIMLINDLHEINSKNASEFSQKAKIRWSIEGDENSKYFHGILNKRRSQLAIRGVLVDGDWISDPSKVKDEFFNHFKNNFRLLKSSRICFDYVFPTRLSSDQVEELERDVSYDEVKGAVWDCGTNKSPGPDGFSFEFYRKYWSFIDQDIFMAVKDFFMNGCFPRGCNLFIYSSLIEDSYAKICFYLASGLKINLQKSKLMGIGVNTSVVETAANLIGCSILSSPFNYLGVKVGTLFGNHGALGKPLQMYRRSTWIDIIHAIQSLNDKETVCFRGIYHSFRRLPRGGIEQELLNLLCSKVDAFVLPNMADRWSWSLEGSGVFSVKSSRNLIDDKFLPKADVPTRWINVLPIKVNVFAWKVFLDKLPTRSNLSLRGVDIPSINCPICNLAVESSSHIFFSCPVARKVWRIFLLWWELDDAVFHSYNEWLLWLVSIRMPKQLKEFLEVEHGPLIWPTVEENSVIRTKKYAELSATEKIQADCDMKATNIILQGLLANIYSLERECKVYDAFDKFTHIKGESLHTLLPEWSKFVTDVKLVKDLHTSNFDQLHAYLEQHKLHANEVRIMRERNQYPLAFIANQHMTPPHFNTYQSYRSSYNNPQLQQ
ncbi:RNA-directed DNA polymerase, eukaryota [Tanacetum coccineum]